MERFLCLFGEVFVHLKVAVQEDIRKRICEEVSGEKNPSKLFDRLVMTCTTSQIRCNLLGIPPKVAISKLGQGNTPQN